MSVSQGVYLNRMICRERNSEYTVRSSLLFFVLTISYWKFIKVHPDKGYVMREKVSVP